MPQERVITVQATLPIVTPQFEDGSYVMPIEVDKRYGEVGQMTQFRQRGYVGKIYWLDKEGGACNVEFPQNAVSTEKMRFSYALESLKLVEPKEAEKIVKEMENEYQASIADIKAKTKKLIADTKRVPISDRKEYDVTKRNYFDTNMNFIKLFNEINEDGTPKGTGSNFANARCCSLTKTKSHILVHVPKDWLNYYGYNVIDLRMWIKFLGSLHDDFKAYYLGESTMEDAFGSAVSDKYPKFGNNNFYITKDMPCYLIMIKSTGHTMLNYMHFIMIRFMYNFQYWNIPTIALQLKKNLGSNITAWEAIMIALLNYRYEPYYSLAANGNPGEYTSVALPTPSNRLSEVIRKLKMESSGMNSSFVYNITNTTDLVKEIRSGNYEAILKRLEEWRNGKV